MSVIKFTLFTLCMTLALATNSATLTPCFDEKKIKPIVSDLQQAFQKDFCTTEIKPAHLQWISKTGLPQIMNPSFLGVEPPPNWQILADEIVQECFKEGNLCKKETQKQFVECLEAKSPAILLQLGPWMTDNCQKLNEEVVENWPKKKAKVLDLISQFQMESQTDKNEELKSTTSSNIN